MIKLPRDTAKRCHLPLPGTLRPRPRGGNTRRPEFGGQFPSEPYIGPTAKGGRSDHEGFRLQLLESHTERGTERP